MDRDVANYSVEGRIGEGAHGLVFKARHIPTGREVALKKILIKNLEDGIPINVMREIKALQLLRCKYGYEFGLSTGVYVLRFMGDVASQPTGTNNSARKNILTDVAQRDADLKPANLLINHEGILKIADLGLARLYWPDGGRPYSHQVATRWYRAPELLYGARFYSEKIDLWSVGCIIAEMITKKPLFAGESDIEQLAIVLQHLGTPTEETWPGHSKLPDYHKITFPDSTPTPWSDLLPGVESEAIDLIKSFVLYNADRRISAKEALRHPWFHSRPPPAAIDDMPKPNINKPK
ncbi:Cyclin-dependent kinase 20 [Papilio xuthus]|uniref:Cyclin-dependent kinase 20 n=1 Tax=Papilio xuthus TaxID=66420 RepID=A0A194PG91_PAPXU|nr:Cyclin-dependent kinase 20 [Papilio xuthus]